MWEHENIKVLEIVGCKTIDYILYINIYTIHPISIEQIYGL